MRRRLEQLLSGVFEYDRPALVLSEERIEGEGESGNLLTGSFSVSAEETRRIKGFLYSSSPRVTFDPPQFYAFENRIVYQADLTGLKEGEEITGSFTLCTDLGEYALPYHFMVRQSAGTAKPRREGQSPVTEEELLALSQRDPSAAAAVFMSREQGRFLKEKHPNAYLIYNAVRSQETPLQGLEEYLIARNLKEPVEISLEESSVRMGAPAGSSRYTARINMTGWGYLELQISSDSRFLRLEKKRITTEEFVGGVYELPYIVDTNFLHAGRSYGRIQISSCYRTVFLEVEVDSGLREGAPEMERMERMQKLMRRRMLSLYLDFRLKKIEMQSWIDRSVNVIAGYKRAGGADVFADLFLIQMYYADGKRAKGRRLLEELEGQAHRFKTQEQYAYYLYISTFFERDAAYVDQVEARIEQMFLTRRDSWIIQWILLYLQERYLKDDAAKLEAIAMQVQYGCSSPILYLEACQILKKNPYLLLTLGLFERKVLLFAVKEQMLTEELCFRIGTLAQAEPGFEPKLYKILTACYEKTGSREVLTALCACLIAGDKKDPAYFHWYALGVDLDVRITGLYEYYMETMEDVGIEKMPQIIRMYFTYNNTLNYHRKAAIFRDISDNRDSVPQVYLSSKPGIDRFVAEQLSLGRIDANLAVLYERFLTRRILSRPLAEKLVKLLFTFEISCLNPRLKSVLVVHGGLKREQEVPLVDGKARVQIYTEDARIFLVDEAGRRYASTSLYLAEHFLDSPLLLTYCREIVPEHPGLVIFTVSGKEPVSRETLFYYKQAAQSDVFSEERREQIRRQILEYYTHNLRREDLYDYLSGINLAEFLRADKRDLMTLLTQEGMYEQAFALLTAYGGEQIDVSCMVRICSQYVLATEYEENEQLLYYCWQCFQMGKYDDNILTYLLMYFDGPIEDMKRLWDTGQTNDLDTMVLEEKILSLLIFTRTGSQGTERIFASYQEKLGRRKLCVAYLILKSYEYLVKNLPVGDVVFRHIRQMYLEGTELEDVCALALLQYFSGQPALDEESAGIARALLHTYQERGIRFAFYQRFPREITAHCQLEDKVFLEYVADPSHRVMLSYRLLEESGEHWQTEPMRDMFEGIFVREFVLFPDEVLECRMEEYVQELCVKRSDLRTLRAPQAAIEGSDRYSAISRMVKLRQKDNREGLERELDNFDQTDYLTKELFTLI